MQATRIYKWFERTQCCIQSTPILSFPQPKRCCDPLKCHPGSRKRGLRLVSFALTVEHPSLGLGSFLPKRTQVSACLTQISPKLILWVGWSWDMAKCKGHPLDVFCCGDINGYYCELFLGHSVFDALYLVYPSTLINEISIK